MGKRRGQKRPRIDTDAVIDFLSEELRDAQQPGGATKHLADDDLFVLDAQPDDGQLLLPSKPRRRQRADKGKRLTRAEAILAASGGAKPIGEGGAYAKRRKVDAKPAKAVKTRTQADQALVPAEDKIQDVWGTDLDTAEAAWIEARPAASRPSGASKKNRPQMLAVEVDPAGCSYNPDYEQHQDAVAEAVAVEVQQQLSRELEPRAPPATVLQSEFDLSEMAEGLGPNEADADADMDLDLEDPGSADEPSGATVKKTKKDRQREARRRQQEGDVEVKRASKAIRRDIDRARDLNAELEEQHQELEHRRQRRKIDLEDKEARLPPRLGRHRFEPAKLQVLASDDVTGSLRKLKTLPMVAKDRFKSLQKRGIVQVTVRQHYTKPTSRRIKLFEKGATKEKHQTDHAEITELRKRNRQARKRVGVK